MPIFTQALQRIDTSNPQDAIKKMVNHIKYIQEQLEYTLVNLDSRNVTEIDVDKTVISDSSGTTSLGTYIQLSGNSDESITMGINPKTKKFEFSIKGKDGEQIMYLDNDGKGIITQYANLTIDGGEW